MSAYACFHPPKARREIIIFCPFQMQSFEMSHNIQIKIMFSDHIFLQLHKRCKMQVTLSIINIQMLM